MSKKVPNMKKLISKIRKIDGIYLYIFLFFAFLVVLSLFRNASGDETIYLRETMIISELLKKGVWIGNYGVGLHGFIFKLPVAFAFIIIGQPSVFLATFFTISISIISLILFNKIVQKFFFKGKYAFWATVLFSVTLFFINTSLSFNRDIPAIFTVLLFVYLFLKKSNKWLIGLILLLMLDAKEHVFLTVAPLYGLYVVIEGISSLKGSGWKRTLGSIFEHLFAGYYMCLIWLVLMFVTSIIPMNMFWASIFGFTDGKGSWVASQFSTESASSNLMDEEGKEIFKLSDSSILGPYMPCENEGTTEKEDKVNDLENSTGETETSNVDCRERNLVCMLITFGDTVLSYVGKALYPRTFSFISIPKLIILPALVMSVRLFAVWWKKKDRRYVLPLILFFNVLMIIFRASHGRYLLCVSPIFMIFFVMIVKDDLENIKSFRSVLIATTVFVILGLFFESTFLRPKIILETVLLILFWVVWILRKSKKKLGYFVRAIFLTSLASGMLMTALAYSYSIGQISSYIKYGHNRETKQISEAFDSKEIIWINSYGSGDLLSMYRIDLSNEPEWRWDLQDWIPKKKLLKVYSLGNTYTSYISDMDSFMEGIESNNIEKVALIVSALEEDYFEGEEYLTTFFVQDWLEYERKVDLKNKVMYIFNVED